MGLRGERVLRGHGARRAHLRGARGGAAARGRPLGESRPAALALRRRARRALAGAQLGASARARAARRLRDPRARTPTLILSIRYLPEPEFTS